ncbi:MAG: hypothetical protein CM15mP12_7930 [Gammaproteobacteria bacterium]|nr:MAG: hypothetical protein CM15mP12_7930 [Gammaproteobacteria bacterium]
MGPQRIPNRRLRVLNTPKTEFCNKRFFVDSLKDNLPEIDNLVQNKLKKFIAYEVNNLKG